MSWSSWPGLWGTPPYLQGYEQQAKQSTRYLARGTSITACNTDLSQYETDLQVGTNVVYESSTTRFNRGAPRTMVFSTICNNTTTGHLYRHGTGANSESLALSAANTLRIVVNNTIIVAQTLTVLTATNDDVVFAWAQEANPDTTGAADLIVSYLLIWNVTAGTFERYRITHAAKTLQVTTCYFGALDSVGTGRFLGTMESVLYENRCMPASEIYADWVADLTPTTSDLDAPERGLPVDDSTLDAANNWHGPSATHAVDQTRRLYRSTLSPLVNARYSPATAVSASDLTSLKASIPLTNSYRGLLSWVHPATLPDTCNFAWVRLHYRTYVTSGSAVAVGVRVYSLDRMPGVVPGLLVGEPPASPEIYWASTVLEAATDQAAPGTYRTIGLLRLARGRSGVSKNKTYFAIGALVDPAGTSSNDANLRFQLVAVHIVPCYRELDGGISVGGELG